MHVHILNIKSMKPIKKIFLESWGGGRRPPLPPSIGATVRPASRLRMVACEYAVLFCSNHVHLHFSSPGPPVAWPSDPYMDNVLDAWPRISILYNSNANLMNANLALGFVVLCHRYLIFIVQYRNNKKRYPLVGICTVCMTVRYFNITA